MSDAYRTSKTIVFTLDFRQASGIIAGCMAVLVITFALGVGFGHRLASGTAAPPHPLATLPGAQAKAPEPVYTYQQELTKKDPVAMPAPRPKPKPKPEKPAPKPASADKPKTTVAMAPAPAPKNAKSADGDHAADDPSDLFFEEPQSDPHGRFTVQFGAPTQEQDAIKLVGRLSAMGYSPFIAQVEIPGKGRFYRVRIGRFATSADAERFRSEAHKQHGLDGVVMGAR